MTDPLRDQLAANCMGNPEDTGPAEDALRDYDEAKARAANRPEQCGFCHRLMVRHKVTPLGSVVCPDALEYEDDDLVFWRPSSTAALSGPQPPAEDIRNALQILQGADEYITDADSRFHGDGEGYRSLARPDHDNVVRLIRHALTQLESPK